MSESLTRQHLRRELEAHISQLGYTAVRLTSAGPPVPEIARVSPVRGRIAYGETVLRSDLQSKRCHDRLLYFSQRRTRQRSSILFFIAVAEADRQKLEDLLAQLHIRNGIRGGHVHIVPVAPPQAPSIKRRASGRRN